MSRSHRHSPACGFTTAKSDKWWKVSVGRKLRRAMTVVVNHFRDEDSMLLPVKHEIVNQYDDPKDGKQRFDPERFPELMRK